MLFHRFSFSPVNDANCLKDSFINSLPFKYFNASGVVAVLFIENENALVVPAMEHIKNNPIKLNVTFFMAIVLDKEVTNF